MGICGRRQRKPVERRKSKAFKQLPVAPPASRGFQEAELGRVLEDCSSYWYCSLGALVYGSVSADAGLCRPGQSLVGVGVGSGECWRKRQVVSMSLRPIVFVIWEYKDLTVLNENACFTRSKWEYSRYIENALETETTSCPRPPICVQALQMHEGSESLDQELEEQRQSQKLSDHQLLLCPLMQPSLSPPALPLFTFSIGFHHLLTQGRRALIQS